MTWHAQLVLVLALAWLGAAQCSGGKSDACKDNPVIIWRDNVNNYHPEACNLKWKLGCTTTNRNGVSQKPPPFFLCTTYKYPSGQIPVDAYTLSMQSNQGDDEFAEDAAPFTLHGLWPGSMEGHGQKNQPYGCKNGQEFDEKILTTFKDLLDYFWPTDPQYKNTMQCFILSEWMKHGTCAVITGADGQAFRLSEDSYFRTAFVMANEFNRNKGLRKRLRDPNGHPKDNLQPLISVRCVECAYQATVGWTDTSVASVPRMSSDCLEQCFACGHHWDTCVPRQLQSTVELDPSNAPRKVSEDESERDSDSDSDRDNNGFASFRSLAHAVPAFVTSDHISPWKGTWRSFGAEQHGSGKFEFAQTFTDEDRTVTTDSPYPSKCTYSQRGAGELVLSCGAGRMEECLVQRLPDVDKLEVAFLACNHTGAPPPASYYSAMDIPGCGNYLMFRCKSPDAGCVFSPAITAAGNKTSKSKPETDKEIKPVSHSQPGIAGAPRNLLGSWRTLQVSSHYQSGLAQWNFTADGQASMRWPNYPDRGVQRYSVSHSDKDPNTVLLSSASGTVTTCRFEFQYQLVYSYAVLDCEGPDRNRDKTKWAMGRCNPCNPHCRYSCGPENDFCGAGSCDPADSAQVQAHVGANANTALNYVHNWCTPEDHSCWPSETAIHKLERALDPDVPRRGLQWSKYPEPQPAPVPNASSKDQSFYGLGASGTGVKALYYYKNIAEMHRPCFVPADQPSVWNTASDMCRAALHQNDYRNWNPFIVVFPLNERHVTAALEFAALHRLCIATAGTGHEYNSRNSCPTGGILIRTILLKDKAFLPTWGEDPALAPAGAFRFGAGSVFAEMHHFSQSYKRVISSGWCSTVGMVGWHLGGGHGPFAPSMGLGVDNLLEIEVLQVGRDAQGKPVVHKKIASRHQNPQLFWAMRGGGGGVWGVILSMTIRAHPVPDGGLSRVYTAVSGTFCPDARKFGYQWLRGMWARLAQWQLMLNHKVSTQPGFFIDTSKYKQGGLCSVTWTFTFEYFYAGGQTEHDYILFRDRLREVLDVEAAKAHVDETNYKSAYEYVVSMPPNKFQLIVTNPLPTEHPPSDQATGSQNSVLVSREAMETKFVSTMMNVLDICVATLKTPDKTSPDPSGYRCGFHYLYTSMTGNLGSVQPSDTAISPGFRSALMLWNARTLTKEQSDHTIYKLGPNSYFSESSYVLHNWADRYWGNKRFEQLLAVKRSHDPANLFWCHHCIGDNPNDAYGDPSKVAPASANKDMKDTKEKKNEKHHAYVKDEL
ncbi:hypothetical protein MY4824_000361 [Beauveria thailandica]